MRRKLILCGLLGLGLAGCQTTPPSPPPVASTDAQTVLDGPISPKGAHWVALPTGEQFAHYYPDLAQRGRFEGEATVHCGVARSGALTGCSIASEKPAGLGFGMASLKLAQYFKMRPAAYGPNASIDIPLRWRLR